ncbi:hypothetical protein ACWEH1_02810 [Micromonospora chersina]
MPLPPRRAALPPILLVLVPMLLLQLLWRLLPLPEADPPRLVNGMLVLPAAGWPEALVVAVTWSWAVTAGVASLAGLDRPLRRALRALPTVCLALGAAVAVVLAGLSVIALVLPAGVLSVGSVAALVAVPVVLCLVRLALVPPLAVLTGLRGTAAVAAASSTVGRHVVGAALLLLLGVAAPAQLLGWVLRRPEDLVTGPLDGALLWVLRDAALVAVAVLQAWTLLAAYRRFRAGALGRPDLITPSLSNQAPALPAPWWHRPAAGVAVPIGLAAVLLPGATAGALAGGADLPEVNVQPWSDSGRLVALGWPAGRSPVIVEQSTVHDCLDDRCERSRETELGLTVFASSGAAVTPDGTVWALSQHRLERCDPARVCQRSDGVVEALRGSRWEALAPASDGGVLIATATPLPQPAADAVGRASVEVRLLRCGNVRCERPESVVLGRMPSVVARQSDQADGEISVRVGADGRPVVAFHSPGHAGEWLAWCATARCESGQVAPHGLQEGSRPGGMPSDGELALLHFGDMFHCLRPGGCSDREPVPTTGRPGGGVYGLAVGWPTPEVLRIQFGAPAQQAGRLYLWSCPDAFCRQQPRKIPLTPLPYEATVRVGRLPGEPWLLAASPDGRVVAAPTFPEQVITVRP